MQQLVLATGNQGKVAELSNLLTEYGFEVIAQTDLQVKSAPETGTTFIENAIIKARHAAKITGLPAIADDSGLEVDHLNGAPGIYSARYAGKEGDDKANVHKLLKALEGVPDKERTARFHCVLVYMRHAADPTPIVCHGVWEGKISEQPEGENGFGYDPIFFVSEQGMTAAHLAPELKKKISHRGQALEKFLAQLH